MMKTLQDAFWNPKSKTYLPVNNFLAAVTLISILAIILQSMERFNPYEIYFTYLEYAVVAIFSFEYIGRIISKKKPLTYIFSFLGVVDLISILPTFFAFGNFTYLKSARSIRILQFLRSLRLLKLRRRNEREDAALLTVEIYFFALFFTILTFGILLYIGEPSQVTNIPEGMIWATKFVLGGVAQPLPVTLFGDLITIFGRFTGLVLFGFLIAVIGKFTQRILFGREIDER
ncbi:MAG: ion transporter [Patescibacteria group bacterium UBA2103]